MRVLAPRGTSRRRRARSLSDVEAPFVLDCQNFGTSSSSFCIRSGSFFVDTEGDMPAAASASSARRSKRIANRGADEVKRRRREADENALTNSDGLTVNESTCPAAQGVERSASSTEIASTKSEVASEEPELSSLNRFYIESGSNTKENRRRDAKASFVMSRFFFQDSVQTKATSQDDVPDAAKESLEATKALRTDDGYLTKMGTKHFCVVCCGTGHKAASCPETRCWICFETGHTVKACPKAAEKCKRCGRKGHNAENCMYQQLSDASKYWALESVRCMRCGQTGHTLCHEDGADASGTDEIWDADAASARGDDDEKAKKVAAALTGRHCSASTWHAGASWGREDENATRQSGRGWSKPRSSDGDRTWWEDKHRDSWNYSKEQNSKWHHDWNQRKDTSRHLEKVSNTKRPAAGYRKSGGTDMLAQLQSKLQKQHGRTGGSSWRQPHQGKNRSDRSTHYHGKVPSSRIRDQPSARKVRRAKQKR